MKLGIVTVLYKSDGVLPDYFKSLSLQSFKNFTLYIIDNSPCEGTDKLLAALSKQYPLPRTVHYKSTSNLGIAEGNNVGARQAIEDGCTHICFSNNDIAFTNACLLEEIMSHYQNADEVVISPKIFMQGEQEKTLWYAGGKFLYLRGAVWHDGYLKVDKGQFETKRNVEFAPACFVFVPVSVIRKVGLMDPQYFVYVDDADYMLRIIQAGYKIAYLPHLSILHKVSSSTGGVLSDFGLYYNTRNRVYWVRKLFSGPVKYLALAYIPFQMTYHCFALKHWQGWGLVLKAYRDGFKMNAKASQTHGC